MDNLIIKSTAFLGAFVIVVLFSALLSYPYMLLWNNFLVPAVSNLKEVEWMQMWGITILIHGLFKSTSK